MWSNSYRGIPKSTLNVINYDIKQYKQRMRNPVARFRKLVKNAKWWSKSNLSLSHSPDCKIFTFKKGFFKYVSKTFVYILIHIYLYCALKWWFYSQQLIWITFVFTKSYKMPAYKLVWSVSTVSGKCIFCIIMHNYALLCIILNFLHLSEANNTDHLPKK